MTNPHGAVPEDLAHLVEHYLAELREIYSTGSAVPETSYYPALANLLSGVGTTLKPKVRCIFQLANRGAGLPDGGLFTADQFQRGDDPAPKAGQLPARGAIEVKSPQQNVREIAQTEQVRRYLAAYGLVLVSNLRQFLIVQRGPAGQAVERESFTLADSEEDFWQEKVGHPRRTTQQVGKALGEFLRRACLQAAPLDDPKEVAWFLASYAREGLFRIEQAGDLPALTAVRTALEQALGMKFTGPKGDHFFRSTLVQTLFYGLFSAWVLWHKQTPSAGVQFDWRTAGWWLHVPFIRTLYEEAAKPSRLGALGLVEVLDWAAAVLNRVDRAAFFQKFQQEQAVQYFYEPFLEAYDPQLRKELGVWYTPPEIVRYQVARVDQVLREELGLADGLADPHVIVLDPCCGTGAYLVEVLRTIAAALRQKGGDALLGADLKQAAMERVFGFEILPAPFVIAHLQLGVMLQNEGVPLDHSKEERVGVYLTNALTGWEPPNGPKQQLLYFVELQQERDAAQKVKREKKILVILGNPPYNAFAGVSPEEEGGLVEPYKENLTKPPSQGGWGIKSFHLDDLYVRFFRVAERRIAEMTGQGVVSFISNFSYLGEPSFVVMRQRLLRQFDKIWIDCMNGDSRETGKRTPDGKPDPSVFSTEFNREGIRVGTAVCVMVRKPKRQRKPVVRFRHFWGVTKRVDLLASLKVRNFNAAYTLANPCPENRYSFRPENVAPHYHRWPKVPDLCEAHFNGPVERRGESLISIDRRPLEKRLKAYFDPNVSNAEVAGLHPSLLMTNYEMDGPQTRKKLLQENSFQPKAIVRYPFKVFDVRWAYLANIPPLFSRPRPELLKQAAIKHNWFLITRDTADKTPEGPPFYWSRLVCDYDCISGHARHFPIFLVANPGQGGQNHLPGHDTPRANLSAQALAYLTQLGIDDPDGDPEKAGLLWLHVLAIGYSQAYLAENADGIRRDWPRIPVPTDRRRLEASAALGKQVADLLDTETPLPGVTSGNISPLFRTIGLVSKEGGGAIDPATDDLAVTAGWGHFGKAGVVMPAKGKLARRRFDPAEIEALQAEAQDRRLPPKQLLRLLGQHTLDVYLNDRVYWRNIPQAVWEYYIGGYQVLKKWLSYREKEILGRNLASEEVREATHLARRLTALVLLGATLDENYHQIKAQSYSWPPTGPKHPASF